MSTVSFGKSFYYNSWSRSTSMVNTMKKSNRALSQMNIKFEILWIWREIQTRADALSRQLNTITEYSMPQKNDKVKKMQSQDDYLANLTSYTFVIQKQSIQNIEMENQFILDTKSFDQSTCCTKKIEKWITGMTSWSYFWCPRWN